jgi:aconitate hydratase
MSVQEKGTICNMGAEIELLLHFGYDDPWRYLRSTNRDVADAADKVADYLTGDPEVYANQSIL